jgi:NADH:ubiquinone oxidoreductase subunit 2 (subunit N)
VTGVLYYVRVIAEMYFETPALPAPLAGAVGYFARLALSIAGTLVFGIAPSAALSLSSFEELLW